MLPKVIEDRRFEIGDSPADKPAPRKRISPVLVGLFVLASVALPTYFWMGTWFGTGLSDATLKEYLADRDHPRKVQHALVQLTERLEDGPADQQQYYPLMVALVDHPHAQVRSTLAWALGWDPAAREFHQALLTLIRDETVLVRRNAALALSKFGDDTARGELRAMLVPFAVKAPHAGTLTDLPPKSRAVKAHTDLALITGADGKTHKLAAPLNGSMLSTFAANGDTVDAGAVLGEIAPGRQDMWEALRALAIVGTPEDIPAIQSALTRRYADAQVAEQGAMTIKLIDQRARIAANSDASP